MQQQTLQLHFYLPYVYEVSYESYILFLTVNVMLTDTVKLM